MAEGHPSSITTNGVYGGPKARGRRSELRVDLVLGVEVLSCWVGGGRASVVRPGRTTPTCRTPQGRKSARVGRTYGAGSKRDGARDQLSACGEGVNSEHARRRAGVAQSGKARGCYGKAANTPLRVSASRVQIPAPAPPNKFISKHIILLI